MILPLVSVIIPTYNSSDTILNCIQSVISQNYEKIEILVIDDGSTDDTFNILQNFALNNVKREMQIFTQENRGPASARNRGIEVANGELVAFLDADDEWYPDKIREQVDLFMCNKEAVLISCKYSIGNRMLFKQRSSVENISLKKLLFKNYFITSTVMCPKSVLMYFSFPENRKYSEDYFLWLQIATLNKPCLLLNSTLTKMNDKPLWGAKGLSAKLLEMEKGEIANYISMYKDGYISSLLLIMSLSYSVFKYLRRIVIHSFKL